MGGLSEGGLAALEKLRHKGFARRGSRVCHALRVGALDPGCVKNGIFETEFPRHLRVS